MKQYFVLTDVHGRLPTLNMYEERGFDITNPHHFIVCLGDYFDRGIQNRSVLRFFSQLKRKLGDRCMLIYGNHDQYFMDFVSVIEGSCVIGQPIDIQWPQFERWMFNGGASTLKELFGSMNGKYTLTKQKNLQKLKEFGTLLQPYYETDAYIFTHASINEQREVDTWDRDFIHHGINTNKTVLIGHTPHIYLEGVCDFVTCNVLKGTPFTYSYAQSKSKTLCNVWNIDNGQGNNLAVLVED
ncbi:hypothetical protein AOC36_03480 [Erysipelothrix larvae]|uniref:Calcineurin-like phosphoesterase domain-containing protein n=1 Tax=Erysipelothrix larvae TaxID=1514105 RepID=A0A0X8GZ29_9FIRM|nr:metallophosphoesterase [Erysipelothrix larvae]AMC93070.1 hypothetical protein AOC36_03480 [Erysipelothrix larvae]